jgi:predicted Zn-dependent protease
MKSWWRFLTAVAVLSLATGAGPARAAEDVGTQMEREYGVIRDTRDNDVLDRVVQRMVRAVNSDREYSSFQLRSARLLGGRDQKHDKVINAFALPDGRIYVTNGLMRLLDKSRQPEDELAFVVGHEITHVVERHSAKQAKKSLPVNIAAILLGAATGNRAIGTVAGAGAAAYGASFSRKDEYRADRGGLIFMNKAGYDIDAAPTMLNRLKSAGEGSAINAWFGSHPATQSRVDKMEDMVGDLHAGRRPNADD